MTQGTRRPNQMEFKARPNIAGECLDIFQYTFHNHLPDDFYVSLPIVLHQVAANEVIFL